jgi:hypothetical protein
MIRIKSTARSVKTCGNLTLAKKCLAEEIFPMPMTAREIRGGMSAIK